MEITYAEKMDLVYLRINNFHLPATDNALYIFRETMRNMGQKSQIYLDDIIRIENAINRILPYGPPIVSQVLEEDLRGMLDNLAKYKTCFTHRKKIFR